MVAVIEDKEEGGQVLLPDAHENTKFGAGTVLASEEDCPVQPGDTVLFDTVLLTNVKIKGEELKFIKFSDILAYESN